MEELCTGGFPLDDVEFSATRLRELCKMDGAVVLSTDGTQICRAATHLMPDPAIPTEESGTRHRTAQRVARQTDFPVISVSQSMKIISLYVGERRYVLESTGELLTRANQAINTLERYKARLDEVSNSLSALEIEDLVTVRDVVVVVQRLEMVRRIADEVTGQVVELGTDGRLLALQLEELMAGVDLDRELIARDYMPSGRRMRTPEQVDCRTRRAVGDRAARPEPGGPRDRALGNAGGSRLGCQPARAPVARTRPPVAGRDPRPRRASTSAACRSCSPPRPRTCRSSTASARPAPALCARPSHDWPRCRSSTATREDQRIVNCAALPSRPDRLA